MNVKKEINIRLTDKETYIWKEFAKMIETLDYGLRQEGEEEMAYDLISPIENGMGDLEMYINFNDERR